MFDEENVNEAIPQGSEPESTAVPPEVSNEIKAPEQAVKKDSIFLKDWIIMLALYLIALLLHILMTQVTTMFNLTPDEYAVTAIAALANGMDWSQTVSAGGYYGYFQSILYIPVFRLISDPMLQYRVMIILNGVVMSFAPVIVYYLSRKWFGVRKLSSVFIAVICGLYPSYMLLTKYTWNETMCCILPWVFALLMYKSLKSHRNAPHTAKAVFMQQLWAVLAGLTLVAAYASHGRMLAMTAAGVVLELIVLFTMRRRLFSLIGFFSSFAVGMVGDKLIKDYIQSVLWLSDTKQKASVNTIENMFSRLTSVDSEEIMRFPQTLVGHFFYFFSSTWGFGSICMVMVISAIVTYYVYRRRARKSESVMEEADAVKKPPVSTSAAIFCWYALLIMGAIFVVSVLFKATSTVFETRADTAIFGRYIETFFPIAMFATLVLIYRGRLTIPQCFAALLSAAGVFVLTELITVPAVTGDGETTKSIVGAMILGIGPLRIGEGLKDPFTDMTFIKIICVVMLLLLAVVILRLIKKKEQPMFHAVSIPLAALLIYSNLYGFDNYTIVQGKNAQYGATYVTEALSMIDGCEYNDVLCFSMKSERYSKAQFLFPEANIRLAANVSKMQKLTDCPDFIITGRENNLSMWVDDICLVGSINNNVQLYACSNEAINWVKEQGIAMGEPGAAVYHGDTIPATSSVTRSENSAMLPQGSAVYTNNFTLFNPGSYTAVIRGNRLDKLSIDLTSDKKAKDIPYEIVSSSGSEIVLQFSVTAKTENVQLKLTNKNGGSAVSVTDLTLERDSAKAIAVLPKVSGVSVKIS